MRLSDIQPTGGLTPVRRGVTAAPLAEPFLLLVSSG